MSAVLIDTNAYAAFKQGLPDAIEVVQRASQIIVTSVVLGELFAGFAIGAREAQNRYELRMFITSTRVVITATDEQTAEHYADIYRDLRAKGRPIPTNDLWIAASALQHDCALFTFDRHFQAVDGLVVGATATELRLP
jgi:tRNA(fMet)-specific endonuclease VapC